MVQNMYPVRSLGWFPIMHYVSNEVISRVLLWNLGFFCQVLPKVDIAVKKRILMTLPSNAPSHPDLFLWGTKGTYVMGKLTIVGFFSTKKLFLVNLLMQKTR